jgi:deazaflavin-dependent oxidoreductase (nitroreductase family)
MSPYSSSALSCFGLNFRLILKEVLMASTALTIVMKIANGLHVAAYRVSSGRFANRIANLPILLITTVGRKTGKSHTNPIVYIKDGTDYLVAASVGGMDWHPAWYWNLKNHPEAKIQIASNAFNVQATILEGEERQQLYEKFKAASANFEKYEKNTSRIIPVIRLSPVLESVIL